MWVIIKTTYPLDEGSMSDYYKESSMDYCCFFCLSLTILRAYYVTV